MSFRFKPEDFSYGAGGNTGNHLTTEYAAMQANYLLDKYVMSLPEVFGTLQNAGNEYAECWKFEEGQEVTDTHRARLWDIQEIKPKKCDHEAECKSMLTSLPPQPVYTCRHCGKRLVARWEEA